MPVPPYLINEYEGASWDTTTTPKTTTAFDALTGDVLASGVIQENNNGLEDFAWSNTGGAQTWTEQAATVGVATADVFAQTAVAVCASAITAGAVSAARTAGDAAAKFGLLVAHFRGSDGIGASARTMPAGGAASLSITTTFDNSALLVIFGDFSALDGVARVWNTINGVTPHATNGYELLYFRNLANYTVYGAFYPDVGAAGVKTVGLSAPAITDGMGAVVEIRGTTAPTPAAGTANADASSLMTPKAGM